MIRPFFHGFTTTPKRTDKITDIYEGKLVVAAVGFEPTTL